MDDLNFSSLSVNHCKEHLNIEDSFCEDDYILDIYLQTAKYHIKDYTSLTIEELNNKHSICMAVLLLTADYYEYRSTDKKFSFALKSILNMNRKWL